MSRIFTDAIFPMYKKTSPYRYGNRSVPRVNEILSAMIHEDYLMKWSNSLGFQRKKYETVLQEYADIGSKVHDLIDKFFNDAPIPEIRDKHVISAYQSFLAWWKEIKKTDYKVLYNEQVIICPYYGGTIDLLLQINGKTYLFDFKTSKSVSLKHHLQLAAYAYILETELNIKLDGAGIILLHRDAPGYYKENIIDFDNYSHKIYFDKCINTFISLMSSYYNKIEVDYLLKGGMYL